MTRKILILAANPNNTPQRRLEEEVREIENGLQRAQKRDDFTLKQQWASRPKDIRRAMLDFEPSIVHFCGHGERGKGIVLEDEQGSAKFVDTEALSEFFKLFSGKIKCVVLNTCYSEPQAEAIAQHIDYVIGMKQGLRDLVAIEFAVAFYDALGANKSFDFAYNLACNAIQLAGISEQSMPILKCKEPPSNQVAPNNNSKITEFSKRETTQNLKYYTYISKGKLDMFWPQIPSEVIERISTDLSISLDDSSIFSRVKIITQYMLENLDIGTVDKPKTYFKGVLPMTSGLMRINQDSSYVYFGGETEFRDLNTFATSLVGSPRHLVGPTERWKAFYSGFSPYISKTIIDTFHEFISDDLASDKAIRSKLSLKFSEDAVAFSIYSINHDMGGKMVDTKYQQLEFLAKRLYQGQNSLIGTPIYVALAD